MKRAADFRREARAAMSEGQYWPFLGANVVLGLILVLIAIPSTLLLFIPVFYFAGLMTWSLSSMALAGMRREMSFDQLFSGWGHGWHMLGIILVRSIYLLLWTLLLVIPGIVKAFSYSMTHFVAVEHPDWGPNRCISESRRLMDGNKWRYFCMHFSFIGWWLLVSLAGIFQLQSIVQLFLEQYVTLASVDFYNTIKAEKGFSEDGSILV